MAHTLRGTTKLNEKPPEPLRKVLVFGAHKVGTRSMYASFDQIKQIDAGRTHSPRDFFERKLNRHDVVLVGIREPKKLKLSAYFHALGSRHHKDVSLEDLTPEDVFKHYCSFDCKASGMPIDLDVYMNALLKRFGIDFRKLDWGKPAKSFMHVLDPSTGVHIVVYQLEKMSQNTLNQICAVAQLPKTKMAKINVGSQKDYAELYKTVKKLDKERVEPDIPEWYPRLFQNE